MQEKQWQKKTLKLEPAIDEYRRLIHSQIDLISPEAVSICQEFLTTAYQMAAGETDLNDANPLKAKRGEFSAHTAKLYGLEEMMPWMARVIDN